MAGPSYLVVYHSEDGRAGFVADRVAGVLRGLGALVDVAAAGRDPAPEGYDAVVAGGTVRNGRHGTELADWLSVHRDALDGRPTALFGVGPAPSAPAPSEDAQARLRAETGCTPDVVGTFPCRAADAPPGRWRRRAARPVARPAAPHRRPATARTRDAEPVDWAAVERFAHDVHGLTVELRRAAGSRS